MNTETGDASFIMPTNIGEDHAHDRRVTEARRMFQRTLASWASDLLILRSRGLRAFRWIKTRRHAA